MSERPRVVFDTNIFFSAAAWKGAPFGCVQAARRGECVSVTCREILDELREKLQAKLEMSFDQAEQFAMEIQTFSQIVAVDQIPRVVAADPDDDVVIACARAGKAQFIVSGDKHLLNLGNAVEVEVLRAADFLKKNRARH
jgi:putative PIN family toxin of toxin-antitoxin system